MRCNALTWQVHAMARTMKLGLLTKTMLKMSALDEHSPPESPRVSHTPLTSHAHATLTSHAHAIQRSKIKAKDVGFGPTTTCSGKP